MDDVGNDTGDGGEEALGNALPWQSVYPHFPSWFWVVLSDHLERSSLRRLRGILTVPPQPLTTEKLWLQG